MWFRNLQIYQLSEAFDFSAEALHDALLTKAFKPCQGLDKFRHGWTSPLGRHSQQLVHATNGCFMLCMRREERLLPATVISEALQEKVDEIESQQNRSVGRKEKTELKEEIIADLLPRAFTRSSRIYAYIDPKNHWIVLDCANSNKAEDVISLIRESLGSFKLKLFTVKQAPAAVMSDWVKNSAPKDLLIKDECELTEPVEDGGVIRMKGIDLGSDEVQTHLKSGKIISKLAIEWQERIACVLQDDLAIKRLKFLDAVLDEAADTEADDEVMRFDADFALMSLELSRFIPVLYQYLGGLEDEE